MEEDFNSTIKFLWQQVSDEGKLHIKLEKLAKRLTEWANEKLGSLPKEIKKVRKNLKALLNSESKAYRAQEVSSLENKLEKLLN